MKKLFFILGLLAVIMMVSCATSDSKPKTTTTTTTTTTTVTTQSSATPVTSNPVVAQPERKVNVGVPQFVKDAVKRVPEDALVGIGTSNHSNLSLRRTTAATRGRAEISRQMITMTRDMVRDYTAGSEADPSAQLQFTEVMTVALSESRLQGASVVEEDMDERGNYWTVVMLSKANTVNEINQAQAAARIAVPAMASFSAEERMNEAFAQIYTTELGYSDRD